MPRGGEEDIQVGATNGPNSYRIAEISSWANEMGVIGKPWSLGVLLLVVFAVLGELLVLPDDDIFQRSGISRDALLFALWVLPILSSYISSRYAERHKIVMGLSYVILFPLIGAAAHYISGELGGAVDFVGLAGAIAIFKLDLAIGCIPIILGTVFGMAISKRDRKHSE